MGREAEDARAPTRAVRQRVLGAPRWCNSLLAIAKCIVLFKDAGALLANQIGIRKDATLRYEMRDGKVFYAWGGRFVEHVTNVISEVVAQDVYCVSELPEPRVVVDIGAHIGAFGVMIGRRFPRSQVFCFEPMNDSFHFCIMNAAINGATNVSVRNVGIGATTGPRAFHREANHPGGSSLLQRGTQLEVHDVVRLEDFFREAGIETVDLLKIDCEGAEFEILGGLDDRTLARVGRISMEVHPHGGQGVGAVRARLERAGFQVHAEQRTRGPFVHLHAWRPENGFGFRGPGGTTNASGLD